MEHDSARGVLVELGKVGGLGRPVGAVPGLVGNKGLASAAESALYRPCGVCGLPGVHGLPGVTGLRCEPAAEEGRDPPRGVGEERAESGPEGVGVDRAEKAEAERAV